MFKRLAAAFVAGSVASSVGATIQSIPSKNISGDLTHVATVANSASSVITSPNEPKLWTSKDSGIVFIKSDIGLNTKTAFGYAVKKDEKSGILYLSTLSAHPMDHGVTITGSCTDIRQDFAMTGAKVREALRTVKLDNNPKGRDHPQYRENLRLAYDKLEEYITTTMCPTPR